MKNKNASHLQNTLTFRKATCKIANDLHFLNVSGVDQEELWLKHIIQRQKI